MKRFLWLPSTNGESFGCFMATILPLCKLHHFLFDLPVAVEQSHYGSCYYVNIVNRFFQSFLFISFAWLLFILRLQQAKVLPFIFFGDSIAFYFCCDSIAFYFNDREMSLLFYFVSSNYHYRSALSLCSCKGFTFCNLGQGPFF